MVWVGWGEVGLGWGGSGWGGNCLDHRAYGVEIAVSRRITEGVLLFDADRASEKRCHAPVEIGISVYAAATQLML